MRKSTIVAGLILALDLSSGAAFAEGTRLTPVDNAATVKECGGCHLVFPPQMLPMRSWKAITDNLAGHFGEDASLPQNVQAEIADYLMSKSADTPGNKEGNRYLRGIATDQTPLRITETPAWLRKHDEINPNAFKRPEIKSAANCVACHKTADRGEFFED
jgi:cytochrome c551/c552